MPGTGLATTGRIANAPSHKSHHSPCTSDSVSPRFASQLLITPTTGTVPQKMMPIEAPHISHCYTLGSKTLETGWWSPPIIARSPMHYVDGHQQQLPYSCPSIQIPGDLELMAVSGNKQSTRNLMHTLTISSSSYHTHFTSQAGGWFAMLDTFRLDHVVHGTSVRPALSETDTDCSRPDVSPRWTSPLFVLPRMSAMYA